MSPKFTKASLGCHIDGAFGAEHRRMRLREMLDYCCPFNSINLQEELKGVPPDDFGDEDDALDILQSCCAKGVHFEWDGGDLLLIEDEKRRITARKRKGGGK